MSNDKRCEYLKDFFNKNIPLTNAVNFNVVSYDGFAIKYAAPLKGNDNDKGIGFAGSIFSTAILTAWGLTHLKTQDMQIDAKIVASNATINYIKPVVTDFYTECRVSEDEWDKFFRVLNKRKNSQLKAKVLINDEKNECAILEATIFAWIKRDDID